MFTSVTALPIWLRGCSARSCRHSCANALTLAHRTSAVKLIKEVRAYTGLGLKEAKELVESAPTDIKGDVPKEEAESMREKFEAVGGTIVLD